MLKTSLRFSKTELGSSNQQERQASSTGETRRGSKCNPRTVRTLTLDVQACTKNACVNGVEKPVGGDGPDRMQRLGIKSHVRGRWRKTRESAPRDGDGDGAEERVWLKVWGERGRSS